MLFNLQDDSGITLTGYIVPDTFSGQPAIRVKSGGAELLRMEANEVRDGLAAAGRHATGKCGFWIDETMIPGLHKIKDLEIVEDETNLLIYRRRPPEDILSERIFRLETHLLPLWGLDDVFSERFRYWYKGIDRYGRETATQIFCLNVADSLYVSGRVLFKNFEFYLAKGYKMVTVLRDPYEELAERLLVFKSNTTKRFLGARDELLFAPMIAFLLNIDIWDELELRRLFKRLPASLTKDLESPLVRQLTASLPDEMPNGACLATALDVLSAFEVVGLRSDSEHFLHAFADVGSIEPKRLPALHDMQGVKELAHLLKAIKPVERILEKDLELYHYTKLAFDKVG